MTNHSIVGQSKDHAQAVISIKSIEDIGKGLQIAADQLRDHEDRLTNLEDTMRVNGIQENKLTKTVNYVVVKSLGGKESPAYQDRSTRAKAYSQINKEIKDKYGIPRRSELPAKDYDEAIEYIRHWIPDFDLKVEVTQLNKTFQMQKGAENND